MFEFTLYDLLAKNLPGRAQHPMLVDAGREVSYEWVAREANALAAWLADHGVRRGDRVGIYLHKCVEEIVAVFAAARLGAAFVCVNHQWTRDQLEYALRDCDAAALVTDQRAARTLAETDLPRALRHVVVKGAAPGHPKMAAWDEIPRETTAPPPAGLDLDLTAILYTSGSSGAPKGVMLSNLNLIQGARSVAKYLENGPEDRLLSLLPLSFDYGLSQLTTMCLVGGTVVLQPVMMAPEIVRTLVEQRVTGFAAVPAAWIPTVRYLSTNRAELPHLRYVTNSGGKIPDGILKLMPCVFPTAKIYLMYGLTEAFRSTYLPPELFHQKMGSIGRAIPNVETYVIDPAIGVCGPGQQGELVHRGSLISMGYWEKSEATAEKIRPCPELRDLIGDEKVLYSGDIVRIDSDGYYWFVGRRDAMIKSSGFRISPTEVEEVVFRSELVGDVVAFGVEDELAGQAVEIAFTPKGSMVPDEEAVLRYCRQNMPRYMVPQRLHYWNGEFPKTGSGKVDRPRVIRRCRTGDEA